MESHVRYIMRVIASNNDIVVSFSWRGYAVVLKFNYGKKIIKNIVCIFFIKSRVIIIVRFLYRKKLNFYEIWNFVIFLCCFYNTLIWIYLWCYIRRQCKSEIIFFLLQCIHAYTIMKLTNFPSIAVTPSWANALCFLQVGEANNVTIIGTILPI